MNTLVGTLSLGSAISFSPKVWVQFVNLLIPHVWDWVGIFFCKTFWDFEGMWEEIVPLRDQWMFSENDFERF
jgi:hypothetical protein